ncbi:MAG: hypothetical protein ABI678_17290 [Kofleriaceae bacterium]
MPATIDALTVDTSIRTRFGQHVTHGELLGNVAVAGPFTLALEYLESVLPPRIRMPLWPFLELEASTVPSPRAPHDVVAALEAHPSILAYLEDPDETN